MVEINYTIEQICSDTEQITKMYTKDVLAQSTLNEEFLVFAN